ncbi:MAG: ABC transporter permease [Lachnospiraceae bacterium]|nr:ABC transporter permease [Lachnospiraceae bacterium]
MKTKNEGNTQPVTNKRSSPVSDAQRAYIKTVKQNRIRIHIYQILLFVCFTLVWEWTARKGMINDFIFCYPSKLFATFLTMLKDGSLLHHIGITLYETLAGFAIVIAGSLLVATLFWWNETLSRVLEPYLVILNSLPKSALAPVLIVWLGANKTTIIVCACSVAIFGSILNIYTGFVSVDADKLKLIETLKGTRFQCLRLVILPSNVPNILSTMKVNIGLCLVGVVIGEFLAAREGLGYLIIYGSQTFKMSNVLLSIFILCVIAMLLYMLLQHIEKKLSEYF